MCPGIDEEPVANGQANGTSTTNRTNGARQSYLNLLYDLTRLTRVYSSQWFH